MALARLAQKGRGRALKQVWLASDAPILAYMDVDLSTDLDALWPLVAPLMSGHSDLAIGSRLARGSRVVRGAKREVISRCYNLVLKGALGARFTDAQCGFKAIRADVAAELLPIVEDPTWFFDTELLVLAQRSGLRIHEVPVDWFDDPDSRVDVVGTALDDLRGVVRVRRGLASGRLPVAEIAARIGRRDPGAGTWRQVSRFAAVGVVSTVIHLGLFASLASVPTSTQTANLVALLVATVANTALNRRWTFGVRGAGRLRSQVQGLAVFLVTWLHDRRRPGRPACQRLDPVHRDGHPGRRRRDGRLDGTCGSSRCGRGSSAGRAPQYSVTMNEPLSSSNTTTPVQSNPSTEPWQTVTSP